MSFENHVTYRRKPVTVHAVRLTPEGNIPITHADEPWIKAALADGRVQHGGTGFFVNAGTAHIRAAYGLDWLVFYDTDGRVDVMGDTTFRELFEGYDVREDA